MASPFAGLDAHGHSYALLEAHLAHFMQSSSAEVGHPSPNDLSAAAILATLADSRPPTSQGLEGEEEELMDDHGLDHDHDDNHDSHQDADDDADDTEDDDELGGILLAGEDMTTASLANFAHISDAFHSSANYIYYEMDPSSYDALDQHAAALESLSMEPLHPVSSLTPAQIPDNQHEQDFEVGMHDELLIVRNKYTFMDISNFFQRLAFDKLWLSDLNDVQLPPAITRHDLQGDRCDFQGIDWSARHCTRAEVRKARETFERARMQPKLRDFRPRHAQTPDTESFFAFRRMNTTHRPYIPHFQLRNLLATTSRNDIYYPSRNQVLRTDSSGSPATTIMDLTKRVTDGQRFQVTTLAASDHVLIAGGFEGEYALTSLLSTYGTPLTLGRIRDRSSASKSHITNHIHVFDSRNNYTPQAVLCSNDYRLRILDCETNTFTHSFLFPAAVNCSATSPDGRMRVVVGDFQETLITNAETGQPFESLNSHTDDAFACAWADDGIHVATAAQDSTVVVWDARYWGKPLTVLHSELSIPRVLRFSPVGGGPRVLVAAEADDYVSIINAQTFETRQVFDFFGSAAGISLTPDGQSLFIANAEKSFGGIMELERAGWCERRPSSRWSPPLHVAHRDVVDDWIDDHGLWKSPRVPSSAVDRERRRLSLADVHV